MSQTLKTPQTKEVVGIITAIDTVERAKGDFVLITVQDANDEIYVISSSVNYWKKVGKLLPIDACVKASVEQRVANVTGYLPEGATEMLPHTSDGFHLSTISRFSTISYQRMLDAQQMEKGVEYISAVEVERAGAVATYLSAFAKKG